MKIAIITGGTRGIGKSAAKAISTRGIGVILTYNSNREQGEEVAEDIRRAGGQAVALKLDVTQVASFGDFTGEIARMLKKEWNQTHFDYLVNNAGVAQRSLIQDTTESIFDEMVNVHLKGPFFLTQKLLPLMNDGGHIINVSSALTRVSHSGVATYASVKGAMEVLTVYLAKELAARKIRANIIAPGALDTDFGGGRTDDARAAIAAVTALGRIGKADDVGPLIAALLSADAAWVNAQRIEASGGMYI